MVALRVPRQLVFAVAICTFPTLASGLPIPLGDAGSGMDAGNDQANALALSYGAYEGNLTPHDADWFAFPSEGAGCVDLTALASNPAAFRIATATGSVTGVAHEGVYSAALAVEGAIHFAVLPDEEPWSSVSVGPYSFAVSRSAPWAQGDDRHADAPGDLALAAPIPEECFQGHFNHDGPDADVWTFEAAALDVVRYSFAVGPQAIGVLEVLAPDGSVLAAVGDDGVGQLVAPTDGTYAVRATSLDSWENEHYVMAIAVGPDPSTCRPYCLALG